MRLVSWFFIFFICSCRSSSHDNNNNKDSTVLFDNISKEVCDCITLNKLKEFSLEDSCMFNILQEKDLELKDLEIDKTTPAGKLRLASEIASRLGKNCPFFIEEQKQFFKKMEDSSNQFQTFDGVITDHGPFTNGEYFITLESKDSLRSFIITESIKKTQLDKLLGKKDTLIVQYKTWGPENRLVTIRVKKN